MELTSANVRKLFGECLTDPPSELPLVEGIAYSAHLDTTGREDDIDSLLGQLPEKFHAATGGGWSFLQACETKDGKQWGEHPDIDLLFGLGIAAKKAKLLVPREKWGFMPGGMPYYVVNLEGFTE